MKTFTKSLILSVLLCGCFGSLPAKSQTLDAQTSQEDVDSAYADSVSVSSDDENSEEVEPAVGAYYLDPGSEASIEATSPEVTFGEEGFAAKRKTGIRKFSQDEAISYYQNRYVLKNPYDKWVDNRGNGYEKLYGVRNFRAVLNGVVYRGGANNAYNKYKKRNNENPLPPEGYTNLCKEGFGTAVYLYSKNYSTAPKVTKCKSTVDQSAQTLNYLQLSPHDRSSDATKVLTMIYKKLTTDTDHSPIYLHCWNGWHASGLISAYTLRQFCDFTGEQAVRYWDRNTDGVNKGSSYDRLRAKIRAFKPDPNLKISSAVKAQVCPSAKSF